MTGRRPKGDESTGWAWLGRGVLVAVLVFLYAPIAVMILFAFNRSPFYVLPIDWTTDWFVRAAGNDRLIDAALNSVAIALATAVIATVLGTMTALAFARYRFAGRRVLQVLLLPPIAIPWLIVGTSMLIFFFWIGVGRGLHAMLLGHVALAIPYVVIVVSARLAAHRFDQEEAAATLGAGGWTIFRRVTLPRLAPGIVAASLFAFAVSFDQFVISYFLAAPGVTTLPVEIYSAIRQGFSPEINAISTVIIVVSTALVLLVARFYRFGARP